MCLGSVPMGRPAPVGLGLSTPQPGLRLRASQHPESWLLGWPVAQSECGGRVVKGDKVRPWRVPAPERGHLGSCARPPHSSPLSQACLAVGVPSPPPLALEWGRLRPHPMEDVARTVSTHAHNVRVALRAGPSSPFPSCLQDWESPRVVGTPTYLHAHSQLAGPCESASSSRMKRTWTRWLPCALWM